MTIQVPLFRSYRLFLPSNGAKGRDPQDDYVQTHEYSYEPIEPRLTVSDDSILDFWHGSGEAPYLIAELPEGYEWSDDIGGVRHKETGEALPADRLAALARADQEPWDRPVPGRVWAGAST
jgi:hypothetical protein